jgi:hypothetical protein
MGYGKNCFLGQPYWPVELKKRLLHLILANRITS